MLAAGERCHSSGVEEQSAVQVDVRPSLDLFVSGASRVNVTLHAVGFIGLLKPAVRNSLGRFLVYEL